MSAESAVLAGRTAAESLMLDTCTIGRLDGTSSTDPNTGVVTPNSTPVYTGKCKVQVRTLVPRGQSAGETLVVETRPELHVPMSVIGLRTGDLATITTVDPVAGDPDLVGRVLRVEVPFHKSQATARRMPCTEGGV